MKKVNPSRSEGVFQPCFNPKPDTQVQRFHWHSSTLIFHFYTNTQEIFDFKDLRLKKHLLLVKFAQIINNQACQ